MTQLVRYSKTVALGATLAFAFAATPALASGVTYSGTECNGGDNTFYLGQYSNNTGVIGDVVHCPIPLEVDLLHPTVGVVATVRDQHGGTDIVCTLRAVTVLPGGAIVIDTRVDGTTGSSANYVSVAPAAIPVSAVVTSVSLQCTVPPNDIDTSRILQYVVTRS